VAWEQDVAHRSVALFCRASIVAEVSADYKAMSEARQLGDRLGVTPLAMLKVRSVDPAAGRS
jgi:Na+/glutamate symporter